MKQKNYTLEYIRFGIMLEGMDRNMNKKVRQRCKNVSKRIFKERKRGEIVVAQNRVLRVFKYQNERVARV